MRYIASIVNKLCSKSKNLDFKLARSFEKTRATIEEARKNSKVIFIPKRKLQFSLAQRGENLSFNEFSKD